MSANSKGHKKRGNAARSPTAVAHGPAHTPVSTGPAGSTAVAEESIDPLTSVAEYEAGANATLWVAADSPPGHTGESFRASIGGLAAGSQCLNMREVALDLSRFTDAANFSVWVKASSLENLDDVYLVMWSRRGWVAWTTTPTTAGEWHEAVRSKGSPPASGEAIDWSVIEAIYLRVDASPQGPYSGDVMWRDLRITQ